MCAVIAFVALVVANFVAVATPSHEFFRNRVHKEVLPFFDAIDAKIGSRDCSAPLTDEHVKLRMGGAADLKGCMAQGFFGKYLRVNAAVGFAFKNNLPVISQNEDHWVHAVPESCPNNNGGLLCFFEPVTTCTGSSTEQPQPAADVKHKDFSGCPHHSMAVENHKKIPDDHLSNNFFGKAPRLPGLKSMHQWESALMAFSFRPNAGMMEKISEVKTVLGWPADGEKIASVHVRQGDKYSGAPVSAKNLWLKLFWPRAKSGYKAVGGSGPPVVFVATDCTKLVDYIKRWLDQPKQKESGVRILFQKDALRDYWQRKRNYDKTDATTAVIIDSWLAAESDYFVGTYTSAMSKGIQLMRHARLGKRAEKTVYMPQWTNDNPGGFMTFLSKYLKGPKTEL